MGRVKQDAKSSRRRICVVFDDPSVRTFLTEALDPLYHVAKTRSVSAARHLFLDSNGYFDAMIIACLLPPKRRHQFPVCRS